MSSQRQGNNWMHQEEYAVEDTVEEGAWGSNHPGSGGASTQQSSRYRGVTWNKKCRKWQAVINHGGRHVHLGTFLDEVEAALAFDRAAVICRGVHAKLNFPFSNYTLPDGSIHCDPEVEQRLTNALSAPVVKRPRMRKTPQDAISHYVTSSNKRARDDDDFEQTNADAALLHLLRDPNHNQQAIQHHSPPSPPHRGTGGGGGSASPYNHKRSDAAEQSPLAWTQHHQHQHHQQTMLAGAGESAVPHGASGTGGGMQIVPQSCQPGEPLDLRAMLPFLQQQVQAALPPGCQLHSLMCADSSTVQPTAAVQFSTPSGNWGAGLWHADRIHAIRRFPTDSQAADQCEALLEVAVVLLKTVITNSTTNPTTTTTLGPNQALLPTPQYAGSSPQQPQQSHPQQVSGPVSGMAIAMGGTSAPYLTMQSRALQQQQTGSADTWVTHLPHNPTASPQMSSGTPHSLSALATASCLALDASNAAAVGGNANGVAGQSDMNQDGIIRGGSTNQNGAWAQLGETTNHRGSALSRIAGGGGSGSGGGGSGGGGGGGGGHATSEPSGGHPQRSGQGRTPPLPGGGRGQGQGQRRQANGPSSQAPPPHWAPGHSSPLTLQLDQSSASPAWTPVMHPIIMQPNLMLPGPEDSKGVSAGTGGGAAGGNTQAPPPSPSPAPSQQMLYQQTTNGMFMIVPPGAGGGQWLVGAHEPQYMHVLPGGTMRMGGGAGGAWMQQGGGMVTEGGMQDRDGGGEQGGKGTVRQQASGCSNGAQAQHADGNGGEAPSSKGTSGKLRPVMTQVANGDDDNNDNHRAV